MNLNTLLGLPNQEIRPSQKIIVLVPEAAAGSNVGIIVDDVLGVMQVPRADIEHLGEGLASEVSGFVKGIIKQKGDSGGKNRARPDHLDRYAENDRRCLKKVNLQGKQWKQ